MGSSALPKDLNVGEEDTAVDGTPDENFLSDNGARKGSKNVAVGKGEKSCYQVASFFGEVCFAWLDDTFDSSGRRLASISESALFLAVGTPDNAILSRALPGATLRLASVSNDATPVVTPDITRIPSGSKVEALIVEAPTAVETTENTSPAAETAVVLGGSSSVQEKGTDISTQTETNGGSGSGLTFLLLGTLSGAVALGLGTAAAYRRYKGDSQQQQSTTESEKGSTLSEFELEVPTLLSVAVSVPGVDEANPSAKPEKTQ